jgi:hypothetical protein
MKQPFNTTISVFKDLFKSKDVPFTLNLDEVYSRIKKGNPSLIEKINKIRSFEDKSEIDKLKNSLTAIMFNGTFTDRTDNGLVEHSGMCILDFDKYPSEEEMNREREKLIKDKYTLMVFTSPSGKGLKVLIRIPKCDKLEHKRRFNAYGTYINSDYFDVKNCNISRVCFESYDPNIFINQYAEEFLDIEEEKGYSYLEKPPVCILHDEQKKIDIIMKFKRNKSFVEGERNAYIFDLAGQFCEYGVSQSSTEDFILNYVISGDFSENEMKQTIRSAYKKRVFDSKYFEDYETVSKIKLKVKNGIHHDQIKKDLGVTDDVISDVKNESADNEIKFWIIKKNKNDNEEIMIDPYLYACFLTKNGFFKYYPENSEAPTFVRVISNKVRLSSVSQIKDFILEHLIKKELVNVWNYCSKSTYLFSENHLNMIDSIALKMLMDDKETSYIPFLNGVVRVTKNNVDLLSYFDVNGYVWEKQIVQRDFHVSDSFKNDFQDFVSKVSNSDPMRIESLETTLGYLIHTYKDKTDQKAVIFNDQEIDDNPNGGSGKSLMLTALNNFRRLVKIDGKVFDPKKSEFVYQRVSLDTQVLAFDDVKKNFNFENLFSLITEGVTVNRKNKDEIFIPFERSPKIVITTNYVINGVGSSHDRRRHEIEFYQYFNERRSPLLEYGRLLFDSWNQKDWNDFDNYMINNLKKFLERGLTKTVSINAESKRFIQGTSKDFFDWTEEGNIQNNVRHYNAETIIKFQSEYKNYKDLNTKQFLKWIKEYCVFKGLEFKKDKDALGRYFEIVKPE